MNTEIPQAENKATGAEPALNAGLGVVRPLATGDLLRVTGRETLSLIEWQPIETAPKDGTDVIVFADGKITTAHYEALYVPGTWELCVPSEGYRDSDEVYPTHWMPLPEAPNT